MVEISIILLHRHAQFVGLASLARNPSPVLGLPDETIFGTHAFKHFGRVALWSGYVFDSISS
jgi:hypothetical protein